MSSDESLNLIPSELISYLFDAVIGVNPSLWLPYALPFVFECASKWGL